ncbi:MAG TPA: NUDIX domain-containing protein [Candidatus Paceibacterota bacterium]|nr:NUDIX domain-containing protein [Candidatus Paceibacterota bacterium]
MVNNVRSQYAGGFFYDADAKTVLLHLRDTHTTFAPGKWAFFGGLCEDKETPEDCFLRELREELGVEVDTEKVVHLRSYLNEEPKTDRHVFYTTKSVSVSALVLNEGAGFGWISLGNVFSYDLSDYTRSDLEFFVTQIQ